MQIWKDDNLSNYVYLRFKLLYILLKEEIWVISISEEKGEWLSQWNICILGYISTKVKG